VRRLGTLPAPVAHAPLVALGGELYLVGGTNSGDAPVARIVRIDPESGSTTVAGRLPHPLADSAAVRIGRRAIVLGGTSPAPSSAVLALS
jgi:N-acetylneuraminic acid mutarotase